MLVRTTLCLALAAFVACSSPEGETPSRAHELVESGATLLDVRTPGEFAGGHIEGAVNIPVAELESRLAEVGEGEPVVVYCQSGGRSASAARLLEARGYEVVDLGAMRNW